MEVTLLNPQRFYFVQWDVCFLYCPKMLALITAIFL